MHAHSYVESSVQILGEYKGEEPFASFLKKYFGRNKKYGSRDRKAGKPSMLLLFQVGQSISE